MPWAKMPPAIGLSRLAQPAAGALGSPRMTGVPRPRRGLLARALDRDRWRCPGESADHTPSPKMPPLTEEACVLLARYSGAVPSPCAFSRRGQPAAAEPGLAGRLGVACRLGLARPRSATAWPSSKPNGAWRGSATRAALWGRRPPRRPSPSCVARCCCARCCARCCDIHSSSSSSACARCANACRRICWCRACSSSCSRRI
mmetsp:Transcript_22744/g.56232  ORF Transcript_22744/g.56232 Transcript_22744/m.56232 type:complete len:202 (+) Transcript_22744:270-875(+)